MELWGGGHVVTGQARCEIIAAMKIHVVVFWVVVGYQRFGGPCCFHLQGEHMSRYRQKDNILIVTIVGSFKTG